MADTKISALPAVAVPAVGDEFACNQAGVTKKETKAQITAATDANLTAHIAVTAAGVHGSSVLTANDTLVHRSAAGLAHAVAFRADAGAVGAPGFTFTADPNTGHYHYAADELGVSTGGAHRAHWNTTGAVILNNAAASTFMTGPGITIQQGAYDDEAIAVKSTDVAHGITVLADTNTYFLLKKRDATAGGASLSGWRDADGAAGGAASLEGFLGENADTTKTVNGRAIVEVRGFISGGGVDVTDTNADGNIFAVRTGRGGAEVTLLIVDEDGDLHVLNDIVVAGVVDTIDVANHTHTGAAGMGPQIPTGGIANDAVDNTKIRNSAGTSVIGKFNAGAGDPADIVAAGDNVVLARTAGTLAFQQVTPLMMANRTRKFFIQVCQGDSNLVDLVQGLTLPDGVTTRVYGWSKVPEDFIGGMSAKVLVVANANGNCFCGQTVYFAAVGAAYNLANSTIAGAPVALVQNQNQEILSIVVAPAVGDLLRCTYQRQGGVAGDTINDSVYVAGWVIEYTARI